MDPAVRPLVVGCCSWPSSARSSAWSSGASAGGGARAAVGGLVAGALVGRPARVPSSSITFGWRVGIALGVAAFLAAWPVLMGLRVQRQGIDTEELKARFWPQTTIDTTKETIEWAKARASRGSRS